MVVALVALLPRQYAWTYLGVVIAFFAANCTLAWRSAFVAPSGYGLGHGPRTWVDREVGAGSEVAVITVGGACTSSAIDRTAGLETEFFNTSVNRNWRLGGEGGGAPMALTLDRQGRLSFRSGAPFSAPYVVAPVGVELYGSRLAIGMSSRLALWKLQGIPRVRNAQSDRQVLRTVCR